MPHISDSPTKATSPSLDIKSGVHLSIEDRLKSVSEIDDPIVQLRVLRDLSSEIGEISGSFSTIDKRGKQFQEVLKSVLLEKPIVPGSIPHQQAKELVCGLNLSKELGSALSAAELAGAVSELKNLESQNKEPSKDFIKAVESSLDFTIEHHKCSLPMHKTLKPRDYHLSNLLSKLGDHEVAEGVYGHINETIGIGYFTDSLLSKK